MQETPAQYTQRMLSYVKGKNTLRVLASTPRQLAALLKGARKAKFTKRPAPDKWSVAEIIGHIADTEIVQSFRLRLILGSNGTPIQGFDQDAWAGFSHYEKQDTGHSLQAFRLSRERNVQLLKKIPAGMWDNFGMHSERGKETIMRVTEMMAGHDINHVRQIRAILKGGRT
jgi:hypothetical protein